MSLDDVIADPRTAADPARLAIRLFSHCLLERIGHVELAGEPSWSESVVISGLESLPIRFQVRADA